MSRITGVTVALATAAAVMTGSTAGGVPAAAPAPSTAELPRTIPGGVELTLADGDRLRVYAAENHRAVWARRQEAGTGTFGPRTLVLRQEGLACGDVDARTANGAVAVIAECDPGSYYEDQAPTASRAIWSADAVTWSSYELEGEAYDEPGISPDGTNAVWPERAGYVMRTEAGFTRHALDTRGIEYTSTATITDTEQVSFLYGACTGRRSGLVVQTRTGDAPPTRQVVDVPYSCSDVNFANVDSDTVWLGDLTSPAHRAVVSRTDASSPWALTQVPPAEAPGLERSGRLSTDFASAPGVPLVATGSRKGHRVLGQRYDPATQTWGPATLVYDAGRRRCSDGDNWLEGELDVIAIVVRCGGKNVVLTTRDGIAWQALRMGRHVRGISADGRYVAVPGRGSTSIISAERGVVTLPLPVTGRCDVVVPDGPDGAVLLTARGRHGGWPTVLQHSSPSGWRTLSRTNLPTFAPDCLAARSTAYDLPYRFTVHSRWKGYTVRIVRRGDEWRTLRSRA